MREEPLEARAAPDAKTYRVQRKDPLAAVEASSAAITANTFPASTVQPNAASPPSAAAQFTRGRNIAGVRPPVLVRVRRARFLSGTETSCYGDVSFAAA